MVYVEGFKRLFPAMERFCALPIRAKLKDRVGMKQLFQQIGLDFVLIQPALYWPCFYIFKEYLQGESSSVETAANKAPSAASVSVGVVAAKEDVGGTASEDEAGLVRRALRRYSETIVEDNVGMCGFWLPMDLIIYSAPIHLRLILNHGTSFFWTAIVSFFRGGPKNDVASAAAGGDCVELSGESTVSA